jgi:hypothetical protein
VEKMAVVSSAVPTPSVTLSNEQTATKAHFENIKDTNLEIKLIMCCNIHVKK